MKPDYNGRTGQKISSKEERTSSYVGRRPTKYENKFPDDEALQVIGDERREEDYLMHHGYTERIVRPEMRS